MPSFICFIWMILFQFPLELWWKTCNNDTHVLVYASMYEHYVLYHWWCRCMCVIWDPGTHMMCTWFALSNLGVIETIVIRVALASTRRWQREKEKERRRWRRKHERSFLISYATDAMKWVIFMISALTKRSSRRRKKKTGSSVTPSMLRPKQITKPCHEHHVYVIMHVMEWIDEVLQPKMINKNAKRETIP